MSSHKKKNKLLFENLYKFMNVDKNATQQEIKNAYITMVKLYHPDKGGDPIIFEKLNKVYNILGNPDSRKTYDSIYKTNGKIKDHFDLASEFEEYNKVLSSSKEKPHQQLEEPIDVSTFKISKEEFSQRLDDLDLVRQQEACEFTQPKISLNNGEDFNEKFNAIFEQIKQNTIKDIQERIEPSAINAWGLTNEEGFVEDGILPENIDDLMGQANINYNDGFEETKIPKKIDLSLGKKFHETKMDDEELMKRISEIKKEIMNTTSKDSTLDNEPIKESYEKIYIGINELDDLDD